MLQHVPHDDPRKMIKTGDAFLSDDISIIKASLHKDTAITQLHIVLHKLEALTGYLPR